MDIKEIFEFLIEEYNLSYADQIFTNCYNRGWTIKTYSFYNKSGCFTIHFLLQRNELDFYYAPQFSVNHDELCQKAIDICKENKFDLIFLF